MCQETSEVYKNPSTSASNPLGSGLNRNPEAALRDKIRQLDEQCAVEKSYVDPRKAIARLIDYHNRQSVQLHALLRALPQDLTNEASQALYDLAKTALGSIR